MDTDHIWLAEVQRRSFRRASAATATSFPPGNRLTGAQLARQLAPGAYGVLATTRPGGRPHAAPTSLVLHDAAVWSPTVGGAARLANLAAHPWASLVVMRGGGEEHVMVMIEGPADVLDTADAVAAARRYGREPTWATAWIRLTPRKILSYAAVGALGP